MSDATDNRTLTVEIDGETHEVAAPDGWFSADDVREHYVPKEQYRKELSRQAQNARQGYVKRDALFEDDDLLAEVIEARRDELVEQLGIEGKAEPDEKALEKIRARLEREHLTPLQEQLDQIKQDRDKLRGKALSGEIAEAMRQYGVDDEVADLVPLYLRQRATYDEEHGWVVLDEDGELDWVTKDGKPKPKRVVDLLAEIRQSGNKPGWFKSEARSGVGYEGTSKSGRLPEKKIADMSPEEKRQARAELGIQKWKEKLARERAEAKAKAA